MKKLLKTDKRIKSSKSEEDNDNSENNYFNDTKINVNVNDPKKNHPKSDYLNTNNNKIEEEYEIIQKPSTNSNNTNLNNTNLTNNKNPNNLINNNYYNQEVESKSRERSNTFMQNQNKAQQAKTNQNPQFTNNDNFYNQHNNLLNNQNNKQLPNNPNNLYNNQNQIIQNNKQPVNNANYPSNNQNQIIPNNQNNINRNIVQNENNPNKNMTNVDFKYDPSSNQIKDVNVKVNMDAETAFKLYQENKQYLPTTQQVISGAKTTGNFIQNTGILDEIGSNLNNNANQPKKKAVDPLSSFFGSAVKNTTSSNNLKPNPTGNEKKGKF